MIYLQTLFQTAERRLITRTYFDKALQSSYNSIIGPVQNGVGVRGGISITVFAVVAALAAAPAFGCMQSDLMNGYNDVMREGVLVNIKDSGKLDDTLAFSKGRSICWYGKRHESHHCSIQMC